jgi:hypothetical protein
MQHTWNIKTEVISVIIGATGTISKTFKNSLNIPGKHINKLQKKPYLALCTYFKITNAKV